MDTPDWVLSIDFGTSNTAAAHSGATSGAIETLSLSHAGNLMPSSVFVESPHRILVGDVALNEAQRNPAGFLPAPKRLVGQPAVVVNGFQIATAEPIAAVLWNVLQRALAAHAGRPPSHVVLTHPEAWSPAQIQVLSAAAAQAGIDPGRITTISEPRAAAHQYGRSHALRSGQKIAVFDFGGGTLDVAVLTVGDDGAFRVIAARGDNGIGGKNLDLLIHRWVDEQLDSRDPRLRDYLQRGAPLEVRQGLDDSIRRAKELLSEAPSATITVSGPGVRQTLQITRDEFEEMIEPVLDRAIALTRATLLDAHVGSPRELVALYLTGGTSRIPMVHRKLAQLGPVATLDDPKTVVAQGALSALTAVRASAVTPRAMPAAADLMSAWQPDEQRSAPSSPTGGAPAAGSSGRSRRWPIIGAAAVAAVVVAAIVVVLALRGGSSTPDTPAAGSSSGAAAPSATTTEQVMAGLPPVLRNAADNCAKVGFTDNGNLRVRCDFTADSGLAPLGSKNPDFFGFTAAIDRAESITDIATMRKNDAQTERTLLEDDARTSAASVEKSIVGEDAVDVTYVNTLSGTLIKINGLNDLAAAKTFLAKTGLLVDN